MKPSKQSLAFVLCTSLLLASVPGAFAYQADASTTPAPVRSSLHTPEQLQELVAPIALYPDALVAQILAAATYPDQIVEADRWMQQHSDLKGEQLAQEVDQQTWDPSVKALTEFPSVLASMDKNLSWTSSLGDAYFNQSPQVMDAVQVMRKRAQDAGNLNSTSQQKVTQQGETIVIAPANPQVVYAPEYDPWIVYGPPIVAWPGWYGYPGLFVPGPGIEFGLGFGVGFFGGFGWGWHHWDSDWHHRDVIFDHNRYISRSRTLIDRSHFDRAHGGFNHGGGFHGRGGLHGQGRYGNRNFSGSSTQHGFVAAHNQTGMHSGGGFHGGGFHGGGFHGGGGHGGHR